MIDCIALYAKCKRVLESCSPADYHQHVTASRFLRAATDYAQDNGSAFAADILDLEQQARDLSKLLAPHRLTYSAAMLLMQRTRLNP